MKLRHWERITKITGHHFDLEDNQLALKDIMEAPLMQVRSPQMRSLSPQSLRTATN